jgi:chromosomal replication initiation ATPase DnaA
MNIDGRHCESEETQVYNANRWASQKLLAKLTEVHGTTAPQPEPDIVEIVPAVVRSEETKAEAQFVRYIQDENGRRMPTVHEIKHVIAEHFGITTTNIDSASRMWKFCLPRQISYYLSRELTLRSLPDVARRHGGRDHTSALSGIRKIKRLLKTDMQLAKTVDDLRSRLS